MQSTGMTLLNCLECVSACGAIGGAAACLHRDQILFPKYDKEAKVLVPGAIGTVVVGAVAAAFVWALYGPLSTYDVANPATTPITLTVQQLGISGLTGFGGGRTLTYLAQKQIARSSLNRIAKSFKNSLKK